MSTNPILVNGGPSNQSVYEVVNTPRHVVGTRAFLGDGREFEYVRSESATAIGKGKLACYTPMVSADDTNAVAAAASVGATSFGITITKTLSANELAGDFVSIDYLSSGPVVGDPEMYKIIGHAAHTSGTLTLYIDRPLVTALATTARASLVIQSSSVKISAAVTAAAQPVEVAAGVPLVNIPASDTTNSYFWVQKRGPANVLFGTAVGAIGQPVYHGEDAGSFQASVQTTAEAGRVHLGTIIALLPVDTQYHTVRLNIP